MSTCFDPRFRAGAAMGLAEIEMVCLRGGRVFSPPEWTHFEFGYLVYRAGLNKMGAIALEKKQTRWRQRPRVMVLNTWFMISTGLIPVTVAISSMRISWEDPKTWQFNPMPGLCRNMFSLDMLSLPHCGGRIWSPSEKKRAVFVRYAMVQTPNQPTILMEKGIPQTIYNVGPPK